MPFWFFLAGLALLALIYWAAGTTRRYRIGYGQFRALLRQGCIKSCVLKPDTIEGELLPARPDGEPVVFVTVDGRRHRLEPGGGTVGFVTTWAQNDEEIYRLLDEAVPRPRYRVESSKWQNVLLFWVLPIALILVLWRVMFARLNPASKAMDFAQSRARLFMQKDVGVSFDDVAGIEECKEELQEIIEFLRSPKKFTRLGGKIPKGVLLVGEPGTGKTLLRGQGARPLPAGRTPRPVHHLHRRAGRPG